MYKFSILKLIHIPTFIISLAIGMFFVYTIGAETNVIYVYPTPDNANKIQYKDENDTCYEYEAMEMKCPADKKKITKYDIQQRKQSADEIAIHENQKRINNTHKNLFGF